MFETRIQKEEYHLTQELWKKVEVQKKKVLFLSVQKNGKKIK